MLLAIEVVDIVGAEPAAFSARAQQFTEFGGGEPRQSDGGNLHRTVLAHGEQEFAPGLRDNGSGKRALFRQHLVRERRDIAGRISAAAWCGGIGERQEFLAQGGKGGDLGGLVFGGGGLVDGFALADLEAHPGKLGGLGGRQLQRFEPQRHREEARLAFLKHGERAGSVAKFGRRVCRLGEQRACFLEHAARLGLVEPLAEEEAEACARGIEGFERALPVALSGERLTQETRGGEIGAREGMGGADFERGLQRGRGPGEVFRAIAPDALDERFAEACLRHGPAVRIGLARP